MRHFKRKKRSLGKKIIFIGFSLLIFWGAGSFAWRMETLRQAKSNYDITKVQEELVWLENHAGVVNNLRFIKDTELWTELNTGEKDVATKLASSQEEKHQYWLYLLYLREGKLTKAQEILGKMDESSLKTLSKGLMALSEGNGKDVRKLLSDTENDWKELTEDEQVVRHLALAQTALISEDFQTVQTEMNAAEKLSPHNPAYLSLAFNVALTKEQWTKAEEFKRAIDAQTWRVADLLYETQKAVLALHVGDLQEFEKSLKSLQGFPQGEGNIAYVKAIQAIEKGDMEASRDYLTTALEKGLEGKLKEDAQKALNQVTDRVKADKTLRAVIAGT